MVYTPEEKDHSSFSLQYSVLNQCTSYWVDLIALRSHLHEAETQPRRFSNAAHHTGYERSKEFLKLVLSPFLWLGNVRPRNFISALHHYWVPQGLGCGRLIVPRTMNAQGTPLLKRLKGSKEKYRYESYWYVPSWESTILSQPVPKIAWFAFTSIRESDVIHHSPYRAFSSRAA